MTIKNNIQNHLYPAFGFKNCAAELPVEEGDYACTIKVLCGKVGLRHYAYDLQTGCWDQLPEKDVECLNLNEGESRSFVFHCGVHDGQPDELYLSNLSALKGADFICKWEKISQKNHVDQDFFESSDHNMRQIA
ncbi:MAG: hypothetical protein ACI4EI_13700 [Muricoprocola sp.]